MLLVHEDNAHDRGKVLVLDGNHRVCPARDTFLINSQLLAMISILREKNPDENTKKIQAQIRQGFRAMMLHPKTPERVLTRLSACKSEITSQ